MATQLDFTFFDCDNHFYEAMDAFTRHMEPQYAKRTMQWATVNGRQRLLVGGAINHFIPNPHFDPVSKPGALDEYFRGRNPKGQDTRALFGELDPISPAYRNRDARLELMDKQGMGVGMEQALIHDVPAMLAAFRSFNRWMLDDWGFAYKERIFAAPYITLVDVDNAVAELQYALDNDARFVVMVPGPIMTPSGGKSPADPIFDPFWSLANESGITVLYHGGDSRYSNYLVDWGEGAHTVSPTSGSPSSRRVRTGSSTCMRSSPSPSVRCRTSTKRTRARPSSVTSGSRRSTRTTSADSRISSESNGS
jgi:hypothetical protein